MGIEKVIRYGKEVWADTSLDKQRAEECLCINYCDKMKSCPAAKGFYEICREHGMAIGFADCSDLDASSPILIDLLGRSFCNNCAEAEECYVNDLIQDAALLFGVPIQEYIVTRCGVRDNDGELLYKGKE